ncbi:MAG TPA: hypothetical protein VER55_16770, partial [Ardenticatenaceae bacterium]|nr:hypothetical protein [Ardenticatenaceae bacterium]
GDAQRRGDEPLLVSEFGTWGLPTLSALRKHWHDGAPPGWWATGHWWGSGEMSYPVGAEERFATSGLEAIWRDYDEFAKATQQHEGRALKAQIELIRSQPTIQGYVITEFTDIFWEANGLLDFYRQPKAFHDSLMAYNGPDILIPKWERTSYWGGETLRLPITLSHWSGAATGECRLRWAIPSLGLEGDRPIEGPDVGMTVPLGAISAGLPNPGTSRAIRVDIWLEHADGQVITRSFHDVMLVSRASGDPRREMTVLVNDPRYLDLHGASSASFELASPAELQSEGESSPTESDDLWVDTDPEGGVIRRGSRSGQAAMRGLSNTLSRLGYRMADSLDQAELVVATKLDRRILDRLKAGGRLLFLPLETSPFFHVSGRGTGRDGNWISAFHWLRPDLPLSVPVENPLDFAFTDVLPERVILGHGGHMSCDVLAGLVTGWVHLPTATICQFRYGRGTVVMCTWKLRGYAGSDPVATALLHDLIAYAASDACNPETTL